MKRESTNVHNFARTDDARVLKKMWFMINRDTVTELKITSEDKEFSYEDAFDILPLNSKENGDHILSVLPDQTFLNMQNEYREEKHRLRLFDANALESTILYDDAAIYQYTIFRARCPGLYNGRELKLLHRTKTPLLLGEKGQTPIPE